MKTPMNEPITMFKKQFNFLSMAVPPFQIPIYFFSLFLIAFRIQIPIAKTGSSTLRAKILEDHQNHSQHDHQIKKAKQKSKTYYVWLGQLVIFLSLLMVVLYYIFLYSETIFILFFILILYFYYHQFFRHFQRINNAINYNISGKFIIGLCCHKETLALKIKAAVSNGRVKLSALRRLFSFAVVRQSIIQYLIQCFQ